MSGKEYRVVYMRDGRRQYRDGFPEKNIQWEGYFHNIKAFEVIGWQERTKSDWTDCDGGTTE